MTRDEITKGIANRFVHSRTYIVLYLVMAALSVTTVVLSLVNGCPTLAFYILELIINGAMILEVAIRFIAFGRVRRLSTCIRVRGADVPTSAEILEVAVQYYGSHPHRVLRHHAGGHILCGMRQHK